MRVVSQKDFIKGLDAATSKLSLQPGVVPRNSNLLYSKRGSLITCDGAKLVSTWTAVNNGGYVAAMGATGIGTNTLIPLALFIDPSQTKARVYDFTFNPGREVSAFTIPNFGSATNLYLDHPLFVPQIVAFNNGAVICISNQVTPFYVTSGNVNTNASQFTANSGQTVPAGAAHAAYHQGHLWLFNTSPVNAGVVAANSNDGPSTLRMSGSSQNDWPNDSIATVDQNDGAQGQGLVSMTIADTGISPQASLVAFKDFATYQITGLLASGGNYTLTKAQTDMGCVAPRSIQFAPGFGIIRMSHIGVALFDSINDTLISEEVRPYLSDQQLEPDITPMDWSRVSYCQGALVSNPPLYVLAIPVKGKQGLTRILAYDLIIKAWSVIDLPFPIYSMNQVRIPGQQPITYFGGIRSTLYANRGNASNAFPAVWRWQAGDPDWDGNPIRWSVRTPEVVFNASTTRGYFRRAVIRGKSLVNSNLYRAIASASTTLVGPYINTATNASPIVCGTAIKEPDGTFVASSHGLTTGMSVTITGGTGNTGVNGTFTITVVNATTFSLNGSTGTGAYTANSASCINNTVPSTTILVRSHGLVSGDIVVVAGIPTTTTNLNGTWAVQVLNDDEFTIPVNTTGSITAGGWIWNTTGQYGNYQIKFTLSGTQTSIARSVNAQLLTPLSVYGGGTTVPYLLNPDATFESNAEYTPGIQITGTGPIDIINAAGSVVHSNATATIFSRDKIIPQFSLSTQYTVKAKGTLLPQPNYPGTYGYSKYANGFVDLVIPADIGATSFSGHADIAGTGPVELYAIDWHVNDKPPGAFARAN